MVLDERSRHHLYIQAEAALGAEAAAILMEHLPPVGWADVATKRDLDASAAMTRTDLKAGMVAMKAELTADINAVRTEMSALRGDTQAQLRSMQSTIIGINLSAMVGFGGLLLAAVKLA